MSIISSNHIDLRSMSLQGLYELSCQVKYKILKYYNPICIFEPLNLLIEVELYHESAPSRCVRHSIRIDRLIECGYLSEFSDIEDIKRYFLHLFTHHPGDFSLEKIEGMHIKGYKYNPKDYIKL